MSPIKSFEAYLRRMEKGNREPAKQGWIAFGRRIPKARNPHQGKSDAKAMAWNIGYEFAQEAMLG